MTVGPRGSSSHLCIWFSGLDVCSFLSVCRGCLCKWEDVMMSSCTDLDLRDWMGSCALLTGLTSHNAFLCTFSSSAVLSVSPCLHTETHSAHFGAIEFFSLRVNEICCNCSSVEHKYKPESFLKRDKNKIKYNEIRKDKNHTSLGSKH